MLELVLLARMGEILILTALLGVWVKASLTEVRLRPEWPSGVLQGAVTSDQALAGF